jgi:hypothetical protein
VNNIQQVIDSISRLPGEWHTAGSVPVQVLYAIGRHGAAHRIDGPGWCITPKGRRESYLHTHGRGAVIIFVSAAAGGVAISNRGTGR